MKPEKRIAFAKLQVVVVVVVALDCMFCNHTDFLFCTTGAGR